jgi:terminase small subunit-like protein
MDLICTRIAEGFSLRQIASEIGCSAGAIVQWYAEDATFAERYARAKEAQAEHFAEEIIEISDDGSNDWMQREFEAGRIVDVPDQEHINRSRLRVDARKWLMAKMAPKRYGERMQVAVSREGDPAGVEYDRLQAIAQGRLAAPTIEHETPAAPQQKPDASDGK